MSHRHLTSRLCILFAIGLGLAACQLPYTGGARTVQPSQISADWYRAANTPVVRQHHESDCGLAALAMVAGTWGHTWSVDELNRQLPPNDHGVRRGAPSRAPAASTPTRSRAPPMISSTSCRSAGRSCSA